MVIVMAGVLHFLMEKKKKHFGEDALSRLEHGGVSMQLNLPLKRFMSVSPEIGL